MIEVRDLYFSYKNKNVILGINYIFENDLIYGFIGRNGAGKTTFLECLNGSLKIIRGKLMIDGIDHTKSSYLNNPLVMINNDKIFYKNLTVIEHLKFVSLYADNVNVEKLLITFNLLEYKNCFPNELSLGTSQRLNIALRMINSSANIIADEPFSGLDPIETKKLQETFSSLRNRTGTMVISSHDILSLVSLCDKLLFLKNGNIIEVDKENIGKINEIQKLLQ